MNITDNSLFTFSLWNNFKVSLKTCYNEVNVVLAEAKGIGVGP